MTLDDSRPQVTVVSSLSPRRQAGVVTASSLGVVVFTGSVQYFNRDSVPTPDAFFWIDGFATGLAVIWIYVFTNMIDDLSEAIRSNSGTAVPPAKQNDPKFSRLSESDRVMTGLLWSLSSAQFLLLGYLVMRTGGLAESPYSSVLTTFLALAPYVMKGKFSIIGLWMAGVAYLIVLGIAHPLLKPLPRLQTHMMKGSSDAVIVPDGMYVAVIVGTVSIAILIAFATKVMQRPPGH